MTNEWRMGAFVCVTHGTQGSYEYISRTVWVERLINIAEYSKLFKIFDVTPLEIHWI